MSEKKRVLMLATTAAMIEQFNKNNIEILNDMGYIVDVLGNWEKGNPISEQRLSAFREWVGARGGCCYNYPATRNPLDIRKNNAAINEAVRLIREYQYEFIHCHNPIGAVIGRIAAHKTCTPVVYTAHGFHFYDGAPIKNWLLFYPVEKYLSRWTDSLVTITLEDYKRAKEKFHSKRLYYIPGVGIDLDKYNQIESEKRDAGGIRAELGVLDNDFLIASVGELNSNKNHQIVIRALANLPKDIQPHVHYVVAGKGNEEANLNKLAADLKIANRVHILGYRDDIREILNATDLYAFPSKREGLSVSLMEAMAMGLPVVCSKIRGNVDLIDQGKGGFLVDSNSDEEWAKAIRAILTGGDTKEYGKYNSDKVNLFTKEVVNDKMKKIYQDCVLSK